MALTVSERFSITVTNSSGDRIGLLTETYAPKINGVANTLGPFTLGLKIRGRR